MKDRNGSLIKTRNYDMNKNNIKIIIGGPLGALAWSASAGSMLIIFFWGLEKSALAVIAVKTVSWGMWGFGVIRESACFGSLADRFKRVKQARKVCSCCSWGVYLYLCSLGERGLLGWKETSGYLQFYYAYYIPDVAAPPLLPRAAEEETGQPMVWLARLPAAELSFIPYAWEAD
jgi:hypothetical protein